MRQKINSYQFPLLMQLMQKDAIDKNLPALADYILSDYIQHLRKQHPEWFVNGEERKNLILDLQERICESNNIEEIKKHLRQYRNLTMIGLIHDEYQNNTIKVMNGCSALADSCIQYASNWAHEFLKKSLGMPVDHSGVEQQLLVVGMGKLGGRELNLSSDIDLIFLYFKEGWTVGGRKQWSNIQYFTKLTQLVIQLLTDITADGFVFRVDTRLRPYGDSGAVVLSMDALEQYYLEQGRGWERFAMIKARLITGSNEEQLEFQKIVNPFVYRRYIDFSLLEVPRKLKRQIEAEHRRRNLQDNIKLGKGGIREIEFIVQAIQLIHGGKQRTLQNTSTLLTLEKIRQLSLLAVEDCTLLKTCYLKLRHMEHCIQSFADEQTQQLPSNELDKERLVYLCGYDSWKIFCEQLNACRTSIHRIFNEQFKAGEISLSHETDEIFTQLKDIFLLPDQSEKNIRIINSMGYSNAEEIINELCQFRKRLSGMIRLSGIKGSDLINQLIPYLVQICGNYKNSTNTFKRMLVLMETVATRTAYLQLFLENNKTLDILTNLFSKSNWIATHTTNYPLVIDDLLNPEWLKMSEKIDRSAQLNNRVLRIPEEDEEQILCALREYKQSQHFQLAASFISGYLDGAKLCIALSEVAEAILWQCYKLARIKIEQKYGRLVREDGSDVDFSIIAMGKLGSKEMGFSSDLDLVFIYGNSNSLTSGKRTVPAIEFFIKIAQRLIHYINTRMPNGVLYEIDTRLRPSGRSGLLVTQVNEFENYQLNEAWTWEHQSLVRARCLFGTSDLAERFQLIKTRVISGANKNVSLKAEIKTMRMKMKRHEIGKMTGKTLMKQQDGGIIDLEFLVQYLVLKNAKQYSLLTRVSSLIDQVKVLLQNKLLIQAHAETIMDSYLNQIDKINTLTLQDQEVDYSVISKKELEKNIAILKYHGLYPWD
ncbi:MAG TPA: bifunctional [glutamate--ammonia ligase]-adenylyl-L-tyrosine phosphorylase/[glutamate--ammonia-ligase] adenylyltransferase [Aeromonadales bacterium]|nr:bifunctional [glutamate--ammonia ligase]-adenylyl-L-tyrosine phosphorylase/[glutamate--ammonia-ligase] adenylyltransferase [Aeromonadales bacterium]